MAADHVLEANNAVMAVVAFYSSALKSERAYSARLESENKALAERLAIVSAKLADKELAR